MNIQWKMHPHESIKGKQFNSRLSRNDQQAILTLELHLLLEQIDPGITFDSDGKMFLTEKWNSHDWTRFCTTIQSESSAHWSGKFWLVPPDSALSFMYVNQLGETWRVNVECNLKIFLTTTKGHTRVRVAHLGQPGSIVDRFNQARDDSFFRSASHLYSNHDISPLEPSQPPRRGSRSSGSPGRTQRTHVHEVGHAIGQPHIGVMTSNVESRLKCLYHALFKNPLEGKNTKICYGATTDERKNTMGAGEVMTVENADPWKKRILHHAPWFAPGSWGGPWAVKTTPQPRTRVA